MTMDLAASVRRSSVSEIMTAPEFPELVAEYAAESLIEGLPAPDAKLASYRLMEGTGMLHAFLAMRGNRMVGFIAVLTPVLPHFGALVAVSESFFVAAQHRKSGAGLRLLKAAEDLAREKGSPGLFVSAPCGGSLAEVLPRRGYVETSRVFFKGLQPCSN